MTMVEVEPRCSTELCHKGCRKRDFHRFCQYTVQKICINYPDSEPGDEFWNRVRWL